MEAAMQMEENIFFVAGQRGMVGSAIVRALRAQGRTVVTVDHSILDLRRQIEVEFWLRLISRQRLFSPLAKSAAS
jgi:GDP-L-fucose synthase